VDEHGASVEDEVARCCGRQRVCVLTCCLLCQVLDLVMEGPFWDGTVDERPGCPRVGVAVLCGAEEVRSRVRLVRRTRTRLVYSVSSAYSSAGTTRASLLSCVCAAGVDDVTDRPLMDVQPFLSLIRSVASRCARRKLIHVTDCRY
jgi:hypothetical protein